ASPTPPPTTRTLHPYPTRRSSDLMKQTVHDVPILNAKLGIHIDRYGRVLSVNSSFVADASKHVTGADLKAISATQAVNRAASRRSEEHTSELQSRGHLVCRRLLEK